MASSAIAEVSIHEHRLTVHVDSVLLDDLLYDLSQHGLFQVTVMEQGVTKGLVVTEHFDGLPIEEGLSRILADWNYSLIKRQGSNHIQEVFLVSKRNPSQNSLPTSPTVGTVGGPAPSPIDPRYPDVIDRSDLEEDDYLGDETEDEPIDFAREESETEQELFTEDMLPADLPPDLREEILREYKRTNEE